VACYERTSGSKQGRWDHWDSARVLARSADSRQVKTSTLKLCIENERLSGIKSEKLLRTRPFTALQLDHFPFCNF